jgi:hypothetical protein
MDLVAYFRQKGFTTEEIELITAYADPEVVCTTKKKYVEWLAHNRGVHLDYDHVLAIMKRPEFHECVNLLYTQEKGSAMRAVEKTLLKRATNPEDAHGVAAARLLYQAAGLLGNDDKGGAGSAEHQFVQLVMDIRQGKVTIDGSIGPGRQRFTVEAEAEDLLLEGEVEAEDIIDIDGEFSIDDDDGDAEA